MTDHKPLPIAGYTPQGDDKVAVVNHAKELEERVLRHLDYLRSRADLFDGRMVSEAITCIQTGFMWANRAVFQPQRIKLPEDQNQ